MKSTPTDLTIRLHCIDFPGRDFDRSFDGGSRETPDRSHAQVDGQERWAALCIAEVGEHRVAALAAESLRGGALETTLTTFGFRLSALIHASAEYWD